MNCIIVDDEPGARKLLEEYIEDIDFLRLVGKAENPLKANALMRSLQIDLLFLDVNMPKMSGIEFLRSLPAVPPTILTTAYTEYAIEGFELNVLDYLVKPISYERFLKACNKAREYRESPATAQHFFVKCDGRIEKIAYDELVFVEAMLNYVVLHTDTRKLIVHLTMKAISEQLPSGLFEKIHKSTIINVDKVKSIDGNEVNLGKCKVVISQSLQESVIKRIIRDRMLKR
ncbi:MAG TPA: LytTR family DNA-binding domain-containing protein [Puia sp.]|nr:LytTR family DNA-binding domain-containing protein [Puia sp.]